MNTRELKKRFWYIRWLLFRHRTNWSDVIMYVLFLGPVLAYNLI